MIIAREEHEHTTPGDRDDVPESSEGLRGISDEEAGRVAREIAEELGLVAGPRSRICHSCGRVIMVKDWQVHQKGHRIHHLRRRGEVKW